MPRVTRAFARILLLGMFSLPAMAQFSLQGPAPSAALEQPMGLPPGSAVLYDQTSSPFSGYTSQKNEIALEPYDTEGADDFTIPDAEGWTITQVNVLGFDELTPATLFNVRIYADNSGTPGADICVRTGMTGDNDGLGNAAIELSSSCFLPMGTYWVSVQADKDSVGGEDQWFWATNTTVSGNESQWRNSNNGYGTGCVTFTDAGSCVELDPSDFAFQIAGVLGEVDSGPTRATFAVTKVFLDGNHVDEVDVTLDCNTGLILDQDKALVHGESVEFVVTEFTSGNMNCSVTEPDPTPGYSASYSGDGIDGSCEWEAITGDRPFSCTVTNTPDPVDVVITKEWVIENNSGLAVQKDYVLSLYCNSEIIDGFNLYGPKVDSSQGHGGFCGYNNGNEQPTLVPGDAWCKNFNGNADQTFTAEVIPNFPEGNCFVIERVYDSGIEIDNNCLDLTISAGQGDSCTITNTVFYEGIPTLSQTGMAILALLMLGLGFVGFRRYS